ncbi:MAG: helix-turn-helix domain-containing protein [Ktedonobacterales bacterium]|nr:helix-turn-helix domain-containing protein [Ktedonobacterales bacterium]
MSTSLRRTAAGQPRRPDAWEWRRQRAWEVHEQGWWQKDIATALGVSRAAVCQWLKRRRAGGAEALRTQPRPVTLSTAVERVTAGAAGGRG